MAVIGNESYYYSPRGMEEVRANTLIELADKVEAGQVLLGPGDSLVVDQMAAHDADAVARAQKLKSWASRLEGAHRKLDALTDGLSDGAWIATVACVFGFAPFALAFGLGGAAVVGALASGLTEGMAESKAEDAEALVSGVFPPSGLALAAWASAKIVNQVAGHVVKSEAEANRAEAKRLSATVQVEQYCARKSAGEEGPLTAPKSNYGPSLADGSVDQTAT